MLAGAQQLFSWRPDLPTMVALAILLFWLALLWLVKQRFYQIALLGFPGVVLHELMHLTVGVMLLAKPVSINLMPRRVANQWHFGSVSFTGLNLFNAAPVACAPLLLLVAAWFSFHLWMIPLVLDNTYSQAIPCGYLIACALFYSLPSTTDLKVGGLSALFWAALAPAGWWVWTRSGLF